MGGWLETYRGMAKEWESDSFEHLTVAYYYDRLSDATLNLFSEVGLGPGHMRTERRALATVATFTRFQSELHGGDLIHIESGVLGCDARGARLAHRLLDSATGTVAAVFDQELRYMDLDTRRGAVLNAAAQDRLVEHRVEWDGPERDDHPAPAAGARFADTMYDTVKPWEIDVLGHMSLQFYLHRFSDANTQAIGTFGMTPHYMREHRRGFSTFEFQARFLQEMREGDRVRVRSTVMHVGGSSMRLLHRMSNAESGETVAELSQFGVHLDLDARRPCPLPEPLRSRGRALIGE